MIGDPKRCGCCGRACLTEPNMWCWDCLSHVEIGRGEPWSRTYESLNGVPCPFEGPIDEIAFELDLEGDR